MRTVSLEELLEAGCHFGHQVTRQNPKARDFIFEARDNIHIIDLAKTKEGLEEAAAFVKSLAARGGSLIIVGTKRQARPIVEEEVKRAYAEDVNLNSESRLFYTTTRWIGGILTNFLEINKNIKKLKDLSLKLANNEEKSKYTKKEIGLWEKERSKLQTLYGGILNIKKSTDALFVIDTHLEDLAVREAKRMGVTTVGMVDTNSDPLVIDYPIPANDDAVGSIKLITSYIIDAWIEGNKALKKEEAKVLAKEEKAEVAKSQEKKNVAKKEEAPKEEKPKKEVTKAKK